jgi:hypothetical protein
MHRQFISFVVAVLIGAMPLAHEICLAGCEGKAATTGQSHHHDEGAPTPGAQGPEHQMAGHATGASHVVKMGQHQASAAVKEMDRATQCCTFVSATARCCRSRDESTRLVPTTKWLLDPSQMAAPQVIAILGPSVDDHPASFVDNVIRPRVSLARLTPLRI